MLSIIALSFLALIHQGLGFVDLENLLKKNPSWSFEVESVESFIKKTLQSARRTDPLVTEDILREKVRRAVGPEATHIVRKTGDSNWVTDLELPATFDAREKWRDCASLIGHVEDEGPCYTDGPAVVSSVLSDRHCIFNNGASKERLSQEMLIACGELCTSEVFIAKSWLYALANGIPTGGPHDSNQGCLPYTYGACHHYSTYDNSSAVGAAHQRLRKLKPCEEITIFDHDCPKKCSNKKYSKSLDADRKKPTVVYLLSRSEFPIRNEIYTYGSVATSVILYSDFLKKPDGVFQRTPGRQFISWDKYFKIIGWGEENNIKYWLCVHTWDTWGDKVFKIPRGVNYDYVEYMLFAGWFEDMH